MIAISEFIWVKKETLYAAASIVAMSLYSILPTLAHPLCSIQVYGMLRNAHTDFTCDALRAHKSNYFVNLWHQMRNSWKHIVSSSGNLDFALVRQRKMCVDCGWCTLMLCDDEILIIQIFHQNTKFVFNLISVWCMRGCIADSIYLNACACAFVDRVGIHDGNGKPSNNK